MLFVWIIQLCPTLCDPMDYSSPGSSVHGILQARILEWIVIPFSRGTSQPRSPTLQADDIPSEPPGLPMCVCVCVCVSHLFKNFVYFGCFGSWILLKLSSSCSRQGLLSSCGAWASHCSVLWNTGSRVWGLKQLWDVGSVVVAPQALEHRLKSCGAWT